VGRAPQGGPVGSFCEARSFYEGHIYFEGSVGVKLNIYFCRHFFA
jgi:hypothetical protein